MQTIYVIVVRESNAKLRAVLATDDLQMTKDIQAKKFPSSLTDEELQNSEVLSGWVGIDAIPFLKKEDYDANGTKSTGSKRKSGRPRIS